jgi:hypothetical protein
MIARDCVQRNAQWSEQLVRLLVRGVRGLVDEITAQEHRVSSWPERRHPAHRVLQAPRRANLVLTDAQVQIAELNEDGRRPVAG